LNPVSAHVPYVNRPLLGKAEVTAVMNDGHRWSGYGAPWPIRETTHGRSGNLLSNLHGSGTDFAETRTYQPGDEPRHINWRATARSGKPMVRVFHEDLAATSCFLVDRRETMRFGTRTRLKVTQAARLAIFLATWEARRGAELGALVMDKAPHWLPPRSGQSGINHLAQIAISPCPPLQRATNSSLEHGLARMTEQLPGGSHVYLISDFLDMDDSLQSLLYRMGKVHRVWALHVFDNAEQQLPAIGRLRLMWDQHENLGVVNTHSRSVQEHYHERFQRHRARITKLFTEADISFTSIGAQVDQLSDILQV
jgi:uncharacterized protein (DUF58 family)